MWRGARGASWRHGLCPARREAKREFARNHIDERQKSAIAAHDMHRFFERGFENFVGLGERSLREFDIEIVGAKRSAGKRGVGQTSRGVRGAGRGLVGGNGGV